MYNITAIAFYEYLLSMKLANVSSLSIFSDASLEWIINAGKASLFYAIAFNADTVLVCCNGELLTELDYCDPELFEKIISVCNS